MARYILLRLADSVPTIFLVLTLVFISQAMEGHHGDGEHEEIGEVAEAHH